MKKIILVLIALVSTSVFSKNYLDENVKKYKWNGVDVVFLEDSHSPTYTISMYFADGALGDSKGKEGLSNMVFDLLDSGTNRYGQKEIAETFAFYGASKDFDITHEYTTYNIDGLDKDAIPTMKMLCHMFQDTVYLNSELNKHKERVTTQIKSLITNHGDLANRIFREISLSNTPFSQPVQGKIKSINKITSKDLVERLKHFNDNTYKKIYIRGRSNLTSLESIFKNDCKWSGDAKFVSHVPKFKFSKKGPENRVYFSKVKDANQAQIRIGRYLDSHEAIMDLDERNFAATYLGGGFIARLMQELRVKRGLTYSAYGYASSQRDYGRSGIMTFTKNETLIETLKVIKDTIASAVEDDSFNRSKSYVLGSYVFSLESTRSFLGILTYFDHINRPYSDIYKFNKNIEKIKIERLEKDLKSIYSWDKQDILIVGDKKLIKELEKAGYEVVQVNNNHYL